MMMYENVASGKSLVNTSEYFFAFVNICHDNRFERRRPGKSWKYLPAYNDRFKRSKVILAAADR